MEPICLSYFFNLTQIEEKKFRTLNQFQRSAWKVFGSKLILVWKLSSELWQKRSVEYGENIPHKHFYFIKHSYFKRIKIISGGGGQTSINPGKSDSLLHSLSILCTRKKMERKREKVLKRAWLWRFFNFLLFQIVLL